MARSGDEQCAAKLKELLVSYPAEEMEMYQVSTAVNSPMGDLPEFIEPAEGE